MGRHPNRPLRHPSLRFQPSGPGIRPSWCRIEELGGTGAAVPHLSPFRRLSRDPDVARAASGDVRAFEQLYQTHLPRVHSLVRRMAGGRDTDELTQDVFVRVWQKLGTFRGDSSFTTWLHRLAVNVVIERFRTERIRRQRLH